MLGLLALFAIALGLLLAMLTAILAWEMAHPPRRTAAWALARGLACDPAEMHLPFEEWWLERPGGIRLAVWDVQTNRRSNVESEQRPLVAVFVHGWGHARVNSLQRIRPFLSLVDRIVLYDLRGHGDSMGSASTLGDGEDEDLLSLLERLGAGRVLLVGHSMGAVIALRAAAKTLGQTAAVGEQPSFAGVIAYGPYCEFPRSLEGRLRANGFPSRPISDLALLVHRFRGMKPASLIPETLRGLRVPLLIVHGVEDQVSPLAHARRIADAAPNAALIEVEDAAHTDTHAVDERKHDDAVRQFIEGAILNNLAPSPKQCSR